jgi:hypothetical protein
MSYPGFSLQIVRMIISSNIKWVGYVARMGMTRTAYKILVGKHQQSRSYTRSILYEGGRSVNLTIHLRLVPRFRFRGATLVHAYSWNGALNNVYNFLS